MIEDPRSIPSLQMGAPGPSHLGTGDSTSSQVGTVILREFARRSGRTSRRTCGCFWWCARIGPGLGLGRGDGKISSSGLPYCILRSSPVAAGERVEGPAVAFRRAHPIRCYTFSAYPGAPLCAANSPSLSLPSCPYPSPQPSSPLRRAAYRPNSPGPGQRTHLQSRRPHQRSSGQASRHRAVHG